MKAKLFMTMAAATMILAGCSNDENESTDNWNGEIRLTSGVTPQTRANTQATQILSGETVYAWADTPSTTDYIKAWTLKAGSSNSLTGSSQYYPTDGSSLDFYALHGNFKSTTFTENTTAFPTSEIIHSVEADQSNTNMEAYAKSDLLYAAKKSVAHSKTAVALTFYHMLSKVEVALKAGDGNPDLTGATVTIEGTKLKADFTPSKSAALPADCADMVSPTTASNDAAPITIGNATCTDFNSPTYNEAIIVPQTLAIGTPFIKVTLSDNASLVYTLEAQTEFKSGKKYIYQITAKKTGLEVTSTIADWEAVGSPTAGDAVMQ
ncbi:fimbrillin family protein [Bacteroides uniformis]|uniref:fimbrillin family protein n=1 Tax=Bacteroides uniformis TaxID=820 RepID=UPI001E486D0E|nr:fimbrillin family protein [Bacteroides uniformis]MDC1804919.1 fimbrillin family protein [Bacteroides uniformis]